MFPPDNRYHTVLAGLKKLMDECNRHAAFADRGRDAFDRTNRTSPHAKMPGTLVSSKYGSRSRVQAPLLRDVVAR